MIEQVFRCNICHRIDCDGVEYVVPCPRGTIIVCTKQTMQRGKCRTYHDEDGEFVAFPVPKRVDAEFGDYPGEWKEVP